MSTTHFLKTRVPAETKALVRSAATQAYLTEAAWFRRSIDQALHSAGAINPEVGLAPFVDRRSDRDAGPAGARVYVRLRPDDRALLRARAAARGLPTGTYVSVLLRSHIRNLPPLPQAELTAIKAAVMELGAIGRNLNQIARVANSGRATAGPSRAELEALLRVCETLRVHTKDLLKANLQSWAVGYAGDQD